MNDIFKRFHARGIWAIISVFLIFSFAVILVVFISQLDNFLYQFFSLCLGIAIMLLLFSILLLWTPRFLPVLSDKSSGFFEDSLRFSLKVSHVSSFLFIGVILLGLLLVIEFFGFIHCIGYGFGIGLATFFIRISGSLFSSSSILGARLHHLREPQLPHFDSRNPGTLLSIGADYVSHMVALPSDLISSYLFSIISCFLIVLGFKQNFFNLTMYTDIFLHIPIWIFVSSLFAHLITIPITFKGLNKATSPRILLKGLYFNLFLSALFSFAAILLFYKTGHLSDSNEVFKILFPYFLGLSSAFFICMTSYKLTSSKQTLTEKLAKESEYGVIHCLISVFSIGYLSQCLHLIYMLMVCILSFLYADIYGLTLACLGLLSTCPYILSVCFFVAFVNCHHKMLQLTQRSLIALKHSEKLKEIGNRTFMVGNSFAAVAACFCSISLFFSLDIFSKSLFSDLFYFDAEMIIGLFIGFIVSALLFRHVLNVLSRLIKVILIEIKRQFSDIPYLMKDKAKPDLILITDMVSRYCSNALIIPGFSVILIPICLGVIFGPKLLLTFVLGILLVAILQSYPWAIIGDSVSNAKDIISRGSFGGETSPNYRYVIEAANVGESFRGILSPTINIFVKASIIIAMLIVYLLS